jgi:hypothetical protein
VGGGLFCGDDAPIKISFTAIKDNNAIGGLGGDASNQIGGGPGGNASGGGLYLSSKNTLVFNTIEVTSCVVTGNTSVGGNGGNDSGNGGDGGSADGGGMHIGGQSDYAWIRNLLIVNNSTVGGQGGPGIGSGDGGDGGNAYGAGLFTYFEADGGLEITNCSIVQNTNTAGAGGNGSPVGGIGNSSGGGVYAYGTYEITEISDCIIWDNTNPEIDGAGAIVVNYSDIQGGYAGTGNINADPLFVSGPQGDYYLSQTAAGQDSNSPCVNAGSEMAENLGMDEYTTRTDRVGDDGLVDMGYHYLGVNIADLNGDDNVDLDDVLIMALQWLDTPGIPSADIAPEPLDNFVDYQDFGVIQQNWQWP